MNQEALFQCLTKVKYAKSPSYHAQEQQQRQQQQQQQQWRNKETFESATTYAVDCVPKENRCDVAGRKRQSVLGSKNSYFARMKRQMCLSQDMSMITPAEAAGEPMDTSGYYVVGNGGAVQMGFANLSGQHINDSAYIVDSAYHVPSTILSHGMSVSRESPAACSVHSSMVYDEIDINPKIETSEANRDVCYSDCLDDEDDSEIFLLEELLARKPE